MEKYYLLKKEKKKRDFIEKLKKACYEKGLRCYQETRYPDERKTAVKLYTDRGISPVLYLDDYYIPGKRVNFSRIADDIRGYLEANRKAYPEVLMQMIKDYESIKKYIRGRVVESTKINYEDTEILFIPFWNLSISFFLDFKNVYITIREKYLDMWNVTENEIMSQALRNEKNLIEIEPFEDYLSREFRRKYKREWIEYPSFMVSVRDSFFGAVCLVYGDHAFGELSWEFKDDLLIVPQSVEYVVCIPMRYVNPGILKIQKMLLEDVSDKEKGLTRTLFFYDRQERKVTVFDK